jgi:excisionase family DNA binding protein
MQIVKKSLNIEELIEYLQNVYGITRKKRTIYELSRNQKIPAKKFGKTLVFDVDDIDKWVKENMR